MRPVELSLRMQSAQHGVWHEAHLRTRSLGVCAPQLQVPQHPSTRPQLATAFSAAREEVRAPPEEGSCRSRHDTHMRCEHPALLQLYIQRVLLRHCAHSPNTCLMSKRQEPSMSLGGTMLTHSSSTFAGPKW
jgi:hypothetical protein